MNNIDDEDEDFKLAVQMSLEEERKPTETVSNSIASLGAAAFLERQRSRSYSSESVPQPISNKVSRTSESQETPQSAQQEFQTQNTSPELDSIDNRKIRQTAPDLSPVLPSTPIVIDIDDEEEAIPAKQTLPSKLVLSDDQLALIMSKMNEEQVEAYFSGNFPESAIRLLLEESNLATSPKPVPQASAAPLASVSPPPNGHAAPLASPPRSRGSNNGQEAVYSPYFAPQRFFRLNWVSTIDQEESRRNYSTDPMPQFLRLRDIICKDAQRIILTTFMVDMVWLLSTVPAMLRVPSIVYHGEDRDIYGHEHIPGVGDSRTRLWRYLSSEFKNLAKECPFQAERIHVPAQNAFSYPGCPHGKIIVVVYPGFLRIAISTGNLYESDYHRRTQGIWFQDFPLKTSPHVRPENPMDAADAAKVRSLARDFEVTIKDYFRRLVKNFDTTLFEQYDYRNVRVSLITSIGANLPIESGNDYGHLKLAHVLSKESFPPAGTAPQATATIYAQMSSIGSISQKYLDSLKTSFRSCARQSADDEPLMIVWPSTEFVRTSLDGWVSGSSLCAGTKKVIKQKPILRALMHYVPPQVERACVTPHIKSYWKLYSDGTLAWMCLTSANFSKPAWGEIQKNTRFSLSNFEAGVLFLPSILSIPAAFGPDPDLQNAKRVKLSAGPALDLRTTQDQFFNITLPLPFKPNGPRYSQDQEPVHTKPFDVQPWVWDLPRAQADSRGKSFSGIAD